MTQVDTQIAERGPASPSERLRALLVDPVLFTAPYDAALSEGLEANGVTARWAVRGLRPGEEMDLPAGAVHTLFYPLSDGKRRGRTGPIQRALKGVEHAFGLKSVVALARSERFDIVHFQWSVVPALDLRALRQIQAERPVVLTVHDLVPFNGKSVSQMQRKGFEAVLHAADHLIVHTDQARRDLIQRGFDPSRITVIPHGLLALKPASATERRDGKWRIVMFGRLQSYKGVDTLVDAAAAIDPALRDRLEIVIAGEPLMPLAHLSDRAAAMGLGNVLRFDPRRFGEEEMATLLASADCFVFPYRAIEASGVLHLVAGLGKWIVASDLGMFRQMIGQDGRNGALITPDDPAALARALVDSIGRVPAEPLGCGIPSWTEIGASTADLYEAVLGRHGATQRRAA